MRTIKCDTCGRQVEKENEMRKIESDYRGFDLQEYCDDCHYKFEDYKQRIKEQHRKTELDCCMTYLKALKPNLPL